jgi:hypothetical protein
MEKVYDITRRHELLGESVPNKEKIFSIYEAHTDIIVKGKRDGRGASKTGDTAWGNGVYQFLSNWEQQKTGKYLSDCCLCCKNREFINRLYLCLS